MKKIPDPEISLSRWIVQNMIPHTWYSLYDIVTLVHNSGIESFQNIGSQHIHGVAILMAGKLYYGVRVEKKKAQDIISIKITGEIKNAGTSRTKKRGKAVQNC
jgi:hypothetical protein